MKSGLSREPRDQKEALMMSQGTAKAWQKTPDSTNSNCIDKCMTCSLLYRSIGIIHDAVKHTWWSKCMHNKFRGASLPACIWWYLQGNMLRSRTDENSLIWLAVGMFHHNLC